MLKQSRRDNTVTDYAVGLLTRRSYSQQEMLYKLLAKDYSTTDVDNCMAFLLDRGYLNDSALCEVLFQKYLDSNKYGVYGIRRKLQQAGFSSQLVNEMMKSYKQEYELKVALQLVERNCAKLSTDSKLARFLSVRGFSTEVISKIMEKSGFCEDI